MSKVPSTDNIIVFVISEVQKNQCWKWLARGENGNPRGQKGCISIMVKCSNMLFIQYIRVEFKQIFQWLIVELINWEMSFVADIKRLIFISFIFVICAYTDAKQYSVITRNRRKWRQTATVQFMLLYSLLLIWNFLWCQKHVRHAKMSTDVNETFTNP